MTGGDSGIGRSVCCLFAAEGAQVAFVYKGGPEDQDAEVTKKEVERISKGKCKAMAIALDLGYDENCKKIVDDVVKQYGRIDILVNNASEQFYAESVEDIKPEQLERTFRSNIFSMFYLTRHALKHMKVNFSHHPTFSNSRISKDKIVFRNLIEMFLQQMSINLRQLIHFIRLYHL